MNKKIEKVFELDSFQKMVDNADNNPVLREIQNTSLFIKQSEQIQKNIQKQKANLKPLEDELMDQEELPRFGASPSKDKLSDQYTDPEENEIDDMVGNLLNNQDDKKGDGTESKPMMSNDDSFQNIAPAEDAPAEKIKLQAKSASDLSKASKAK